MSLNETLRQIKSNSRSRIPADAAAIMAQATQNLEESGILDNALKAGDKAPSFELDDWQGNHYKSHDLLAEGPLILTIYRGSW